MRFYILFLLISLFCADLYAQSQPFIYFDTLQWRCIGPFRGGRSCTVTGVEGNLISFILVLQAVFGKRKMEVNLGTIFQMAILVDRLDQWLLVVR